MLSTTNLPIYQIHKSSAVYLTIVFISIVAMVSLPFIRLDISVRTSGIIRPINERTEIKPIQGGIIDTIFYREGQAVPKGAVLLRLRDNSTRPKTIQNRYELTQRRQNIHDLQLLTEMGYVNSGTVGNLESPVYKQQISKFLYQQTSQEADLKKVSKEMEMDNELIKDKVIAPKEHFDKQVEQEKMNASNSAFKTEQQSIWQQELAKNRLELSQFEAQKKQVEAEKILFEVKAPISGVVQNINNRYAGGILQAGESLCTISPETDLVAECYVPTNQVGLLKVGQSVKFQIDAFNYNYFGILSGKVTSIDNDFTSMDNKPVFKVHCSFDNSQLHLKNGYAGQLKKGLTFQSRFMVTRRSLWQLLFDNIDDWLNPSAPNVGT